MTAPSLRNFRRANPSCCVVGRGRMETGALWIGAFGVYGLVLLATFARIAATTPFAQWNSVAPELLALLVFGLPFCTLAVGAALRDAWTAWRHVYAVGVGEILFVAGARRDRVPIATFQLTGISGTATAEVLKRLSPRSRDRLLRTVKARGGLSRVEMPPKPEAMSSPWSVRRAFQAANASAVTLRGWPDLRRHWVPILIGALMVACIAVLVWLITDADRRLLIALLFGPFPVIGVVMLTSMTLRARRHLVMVGEHEVLFMDSEGNHEVHGIEQLPLARPLRSASAFVGKVMEENRRDYALHLLVEERASPLGRKAATSSKSPLDDAYRAAGASTEAMRLPPELPPLDDEHARIFRRLSSWFRSRRDAAAQALIRRSDPTLWMHAIVRCLTPKEDDYVYWQLLERQLRSEQAVESLAQSSPDATPPAISLPAGIDEAMDRLRDTTVLDTLTRRVEREADPARRTVAIHLIVGSDPAPVVDSLRSFLLDDDRSRTMSAKVGKLLLLHAMERVDPRFVTTALTLIADDVLSSKSRLAAVRALGRHADIALMRTAVGTDRLDTLGLLSRALEHVGADALAPLLDSQHARVRDAAFQALAGDAADAQRLELLSEHLSSEEPAGRRRWLLSELVRRNLKAAPALLGHAIATAPGLDELLDLLALAGELRHPGSLPGILRAREHVVSLCAQIPNEKRRDTEIARGQAAIDDVVRAIEQQRTGNP